MPQDKGSRRTLKKARQGCDKENKGIPLFGHSGRSSRIVWSAGVLPVAVVNSCLIWHRACRIASLTDSYVNMGMLKDFEISQMTCRRHNGCPSANTSCVQRPSIRVRNPSVLEHVRLNGLSSRHGGAIMILTRSASSSLPIPRDSRVSCHRVCTCSDQVNVINHLAALWHPIQTAWSADSSFTGPQTVRWYSKNRHACSESAFLSSNPASTRPRAHMLTYSTAKAPVRTPR